MGIRSVALDRHGEQYTKAIEGQVAAHTVLEEAARQWRVSLSENPHGYKSIKQGAVPKGRPLVSFSSRLGLETGKIRL